MISKSKKFWVVLSLSLLALGLMAFTPLEVLAAPTWDGQGGPNGQGGNGQGNGQGCGCVTPGTGAALTPLSDAEAKALQDAILEEYSALNLYQAVLDKFGATLPFSRIVRSEQQHVNALLRQAEKYGVEAPANPGLASPITFTTLAEAYQAGVDAETANAAFYDELKAATTHRDLLAVYNRLQRMSLKIHLPAFEACL